MSLTHVCRCGICGSQMGAITFDLSNGTLVKNPGPMPSWQEYDCHKCAGFKATTYMILCPECGNKRCPKASDHDLACTNSNEPGQAGSLF